MITLTAQQFKTFQDEMIQLKAQIDELDLLREKIVLSPDHEKRRYRKEGELSALKTVLDMMELNQKENPQSAFCAFSEEQIAKLNECLESKEADIVLDLSCTNDKSTVRELLEEFREIAEIERALKHG